ncbi:PEP/pyruvate-binding domain-containing protein [Echinicola jeungdonensis]|uniref:PEP/pyruvate-binding domain-containing protein n=1 Tax=Echinicola jeungdonensis TaxID=709343 RepID=UPI0025B474F3|nr:PEP/pyruvate-binding domain-containing protein [Echinicola jeungdonensis]MDN3671246.1 PEP/pyruvate-binding domain-containing protein [Echinicola jeungdonensis]
MQKLNKKCSYSKAWEQAILQEYRKFFGADAGEVSVAVRSSATAEDLPMQVLLDNMIHFKYPR